jgi:hypothetical protein
VCFAGLFGWWEVEGSNCDGFGVLVLFYFSFSLVRTDHAEWNVHDGGNNDIHSHWRLLGRSLDGCMEQCVDGVCIASMHAHGSVGRSVSLGNNRSWVRTRSSDLVDSKMGIAGLIF